MSGVNNLFQNKTVLAPLAGITNLPFRLIARRFGCDMCFTEMISANGLIRESAKTIEYLKTCPEDQPLGIQLFGADPGVLAQAAVIVSDFHPAVIDINMGCPVKKVIKAGAGAVLMRDPALAGRIIKAVVDAVSVPVTVKIRSGWSQKSINAIEISKIAEDSGISAIIVHGRTVDQGFSGHVDWSVIARVKNAVKIPVIGNGDIRQPEDARKMRSETGCDAVMIGRGALGNPWIFQGIHQPLADVVEDYRPSLSQRMEIIKQHWEMEEYYLGKRIADKSFRKHLLWYTRGLTGSGRFRETVGKMTDSDAMLAELDRYFQVLAETQAKITT
ncbi:MAG: tRNA dihydrouridine synthase DusB [Deltaproteobacteria bacterium HGW-Deltaproteobacteria-1]|nr:MAG: tRNA dihydrouridine synthase DusB [Deltaproteobacteria bacterium HGW-Deltaproteobacteria-1]